MEEKMKNLVQDHEFMNKMLSCEEPEQVQKLFADNGVEITLEEVKTLGKVLAGMAQSDGELSEDDLEGVAGGSVWDKFREMIELIGMGAPRTSWDGIKRVFTRW